MIINESREDSVKITAKNPKEFIQKCKNSGQFNDKQIYAISQGLRNDISLEQAQFIADSKFKASQMLVISWGFEDNLTMEEVRLYAKPEISSKQMDEIRDDLVNGMSIKEVKKKYKITESKKDHTRLIINNPEKLNKLIDSDMNEDKNWDWNDEGFSYKKDLQNKLAGIINNKEKSNRIKPSQIIINQIQQPASNGKNPLELVIDGSHHYAMGVEYLKSILKQIGVDFKNK